MDLSYRCAFWNSLGANNSLIPPLEDSIMSRNAKRFRSIALAIVAIAATNYAITFASGVPIRPDAPKPKKDVVSSGVPIRPDAPKPKF
jgi:hypothetical protein